MKIVQHCVYFPPEVGGLESHVYYLCKGMVERGHDVTVITSRSLPGVPSYEVMDGIEVHRTWFPSRSPAGWIAHSLGSTAATTRAARDADILHAQAFPSNVPCALARVGRSTPLVSTLHTSHFLTRAARPGWGAVLEKVVALADYNFAASQEIADVGEALGPGIRVEALTNGVETAFFKPGPPSLDRASGRRIIVPRRLFPKNGVEYFVRAMPMIVAAVEGVEAVLIGDGPERDRLERLAGELGVSENMVFLGARPHEEMPGLLCSGDLAVFPSLMEATSVAALESMACALPVAASNVGGLPEIVDGAVGGLFEPADPQSLAHKVTELLLSDQLPVLGKHARERVEASWSNARLVDRHLEVYEALLHRSDPTIRGYAS